MKFWSCLAYTDLFISRFNFKNQIVRKIQGFEKVNFFIDSYVETLYIKALSCENSNGVIILGLDFQHANNLLNISTVNCLH